MSHVNKAIVRGYLEDLLNQGNTATIAQYFDIDRLTFNGAPFGYEQLVQLVRTFREAFPDLHLTIEEQLVASHHVITRGTFRGTHHGAWFGVAPTGKRVMWPAIAIDRIAQGKVVEMWHVADVLGMPHQLGTVPSDLVIQEEDAG